MKIKRKRNFKTWLWKQKLLMDLKWIFNSLSSFNKLCNTKTFQNEPRFNGVYSKDNLPKTIKGGTYVINLDKYANFDTHWIDLYNSNTEIIYFDSFEIEHVPEAIKKIIGHKIDIIRMQANNSIMCRYLAFTDFTRGGKTLSNYTSLITILIQKFKKQKQ